MTSVSYGLALPLSMLISSAASAATVTTLPSKNGKVTVSLSGEIAQGDFDALKENIRKANNGNLIVSLIRLDSPGGNVLEGVKLADIIRFGKIATSVVGTSKCASACFIVFAAGSEKFANYTASIGVHGASDENGQETDGSSAVTVSMARVLKELGVPAGILGKMVVTPPEQMVWLTPDELRSMGVTMTGKPSQLPPTPPVTSQLPSELKPDSRSSASESKPLPTWAKLLDSALDLSKQQHDGTPDFARVCQPELAVCINALSFATKDGTKMILKVTEDMNGKTLRREICSFNDYGDVRNCTDWETGATHRDMKNKRGDWQTVGDN
jgi:hypothetical protein